MNYLVTGCAGFIGYQLSAELLKQGISVVGYDNLNTYYEKSLKEARLSQLHTISKNVNVPFYFFKDDLSNQEGIEKVFSLYNPEKVINLAGQAGVRFSIENPRSYVDSNLIGFFNILEACRRYSIKHLVYASSSSVYGGNSKQPFSENDAVENPISFYAATKKSNELMAHSYSHLYGIPTTGLRFFTVYGPWGRPDMAPFLFIKSIIENNPINIFNEGNMSRDFTFIDDITKSILKVLEKIPTSKSYSASEINFSNLSNAPYRIFNIGNSKPVFLMDFIKTIENATGQKAIKNFMPMQKGDVKSTFADTKLLEDWINFKPNTSIQEGINKTVDWYLDFYKKS